MLLETRARATLEAPAAVGTTEPVELQAETETGQISVVFAEGIPVDEPIRATICVERNGVAVQPDLDELKLTVVGTPPTMIAHSTQLYTDGQIFRIGIVLDLVGIELLEPS